MGICHMTQGTKTGAVWQSGRVGGGERWTGGSGGRGHGCVPMVDSWWCMTENLKILKSNYLSIKTMKWQKKQNKKLSH